VGGGNGAAIDSSTASFSEQQQDQPFVPSIEQFCTAAQSVPFPPSQLAGTNICINSVEYLVTEVQPRAKPPGVRLQDPDGSNHFMSYETLLASGYEMCTGFARPESWSTTAVQFSCQNDGTASRMSTTRTPYEYMVDVFKHRILLDQIDIKADPLKGLCQIKHVSSQPSNPGTCTLCHHVLS
jgi:hypothetical protein